MLKDIYIYIFLYFMIIFQIDKLFLFTSYFTRFFEKKSRKKDD
jgi:hypothetical protein